MSRPNGQHTVPPLSREQELTAYQQMLLIRRFEEKAGQLYGMGLIGGFCHLYIGQEAVAVGVCAHLRPDDYVTSTHRGHGHAIAKGVDPGRMMAELFGRATGTNRGKSGSKHIADVSAGMLGASGIVGGGIPLAVGAAMSATVAERRQIHVPASPWPTTATLRRQAVPGRDG